MVAKESQFSNPLILELISECRYGEYGNYLVFLPDKARNK